MESPNPGGAGIPGLGILGRLGEKILGWIALLLLLLLGYGVYRLGPEGRGAILSATGRIVLWIVIAIALPWVTRFFIRRVLEVGANWAGLALIAALTLIDIVVGLILMGGWPAGFWGWLVALAVVAAAATYNYLVAEYVAERYGGL